MDLSGTTAEPHADEPVVGVLCWKAMSARVELRDTEVRMLAKRRRMSADLVLIAAATQSTDGSVLSGGESARTGYQWRLAFSVDVECVNFGKRRQGWTFSG